MLDDHVAAAQAAQLQDTARLNGDSTSPADVTTAPLDGTAILPAGAEAPVAILDTILPPDSSGAFSGNGQVEARDTADLAALQAGQEQAWAAMGIDPSKTVENDPGGLSEAEDERREELRQAAIAYAERDWRIIPVRWITSDGVCSCRRGADCDSPGKHPVHWGWPDLATSDSIDVASWWRPQPTEGYMAEEWFPLANIGIVTGKGSGIFVLDVDPDNGGPATLAELERQHGELPLTRTHRTGSGGSHRLFRWPGFALGNSAGTALGEGLDIRGEHGFVVAPPSVSRKGSYEVTLDAEVADAPGWLVERLRDHAAPVPRRLPQGRPVRGTGPVVGLARRGAARAQLRGLLTSVIGAEAGTRNNILHWAACRAGEMVAAGLVDEDVAIAALVDAAMRAGQPYGQAVATVLSGMRKAASS